MSVVKPFCPSKCNREERQRDVVIHEVQSIRVLLTLFAPANVTERRDSAM